MSQELSPLRLVMIGRRWSPVVLFMWAWRVLLRVASAITVFEMMRLEWTWDYRYPETVVSSVPCPISEQSFVINQLVHSLVLARAEKNHKRYKYSEKERENLLNKRDKD